MSNTDPQLLNTTGTQPETSKRTPSSNRKGRPSAAIRLERENAYLPKLDKFVIKSPVTRKRSFESVGVDTHTSTQTTPQKKQHTEGEPPVRVPTLTIKEPALTPMEEHSNTMTDPSKATAGGGDQHSSKSDSRTNEHDSNSVAGLRRDIKSMLQDCVAEIVMSFNEKLDEVRNELVRRDAQFEAFQKQANARFEAIDARLNELAFTPRVSSDIPSPTPELNNTVSKCVNWINKQERLSRRNNIVIKGVHFEQSNLPQQVRDFLETRLGLKEEVVSARKLPTPGPSPSYLAVLSSWESKLRILRAEREKLRNFPIYINQDLTPKDKHVQFLLRTKAREARAEGKSVQLRNDESRIENKWYQ